MYSPQGGLANQQRIPLQNWPPGYSLLMVPLVAMGIGETTSGFALSLVAGLVVIGLLAWQMATEFGAEIGALMMMLVVTSGAFVWMSAACLSDMSYLALSLASLLVFKQALKDTSRVLPWYAAGLLAGFAWCIRYAALALLAASAVYFITRALQERNARRWIGPSVAWSLGVASAAGWLVCRNILMFGSPNPYDLPPSDLSLLHNTAKYLYTLLSDFTVLVPLVHHSSKLGGWSSGLTALGTAAVVLLIVAIAGMALSGRRLVRVPLTRVVGQLSEDAFFIAYAAFYSAVVILARTRFQWGESIHSRHTLQVFAVVVIVIVGMVLRAWPRHTRLVTLALGGVVLVQLAGFGVRTFALVTHNRRLFEILTS